MELPELLLIDKPTGITSFDVIRVLQRLFKMKLTGHARTLTFTPSLRGVRDAQQPLEFKLTPELEAGFDVYIQQNPSVRKLVCGHAGTLDPAASGLMLLGVGAGTKKLTEYIKLDKEYVADIVLGESRTTGDQDGEVLESATVNLTPELSDIIAATVDEMVGTLRLPVSAYSAIKKDGIPMYKRARAAAKVGELVQDVPWRDMTVLEAELQDTKTIVINDDTRVVVTVRFSVGSGTYIRSLAEELGRRLGYPACLMALRRTKVGEFRIEDAQTLTAFDAYPNK